MSSGKRKAMRAAGLVLAAAMSAMSFAAIGAAEEVTMTPTPMVAMAQVSSVGSTAHPVAKLRLNASHVLAGATVVASTKGSSARAGVKSVTFTFGDGTKAVRRTTIPRTLAHTFRKLGRHVVTMRLVDRLGHVSRIQRVVVVSARPQDQSLSSMGAAPPSEDVQPDTTLRSADGLPSSVDLRGDTLTPQNQAPGAARIGSCVTWATNYGLLGWYAHHTGMSTQVFAPMYSYSQVDGGVADAGSDPVDVLNIALNQGVDTAAHYGSGWAYDYVTKPNDSQRANAANYKISGWRTLYSNKDLTGSTNAEAYSLRAQLASGYPAIIGMKVYQPLRTFHGSGYYTDPAGAVYSGLHEVLAVGYDSQGLLIQNSWGTAWGDNGFFRLSWAAVGADVMDAHTITGFVPAQSQSDSTSPTATAPVQQVKVGDTLNANGVPVTVSWSGSDNTGVSAYDFFASTNGGAWTQQTLPNANATSITYSLTPGNSYRFAVRSRDAAGNVSPWMYGSTFTVGDYQETSSAFNYNGSWNTYGWSLADAGQLALSNTANDWFSFTFTGSNVAWVGTKAANRGEAYVWLDGNYVGTADEYAASTAAKSLIVVGNWDTVAQHTITVQVVGTSGRPDVDVDSFVVLG